MRDDMVDIEATRSPRVICDLLHDGRAIYRSLFELNPDAVYAFSIDGQLIAANVAHERITGYPHGSIDQQWLTTLIHPNYRDAVRSTFYKATAGSVHTCSFPIIHQCGHIVEVTGTYTPMVLDGETVGVFLTLRGVGHEPEVDGVVTNRTAFFDTLTGLPNRALFTIRLEQAIHLSRNTGDHMAVLMLDLDRFKVINDTLGTALGDKLLQAIAGRLAKSVRDKDVVSRTDGDQFSLLLQGVAHREDVLLLADRVLAAITQSILIENYELHVSCSIGVAIIPDDGIDAGTVMEHADIALNHAKDQGRGQIQVYHRTITDVALHRLHLENALRKALSHNELSVHYQPRFCLLSRQIVGVEALLRWNHPRHGNIPPSDFIPLAEDLGLIVSIGDWVLKESTRQAKAWVDAGMPPVVLAVNLSAIQLKQMDFVQTVRDVLDTSGWPPELLEFEITESIIVNNEDGTANKLATLRDMGIRISIDDFGIGYSSFSYLKTFPVDTLKVDQSFIHDIAHNTGDQAITNAIVTMAHTLSYKVIAEGVETPEQLAYLESLGCDEIQGFLFSPPMSGPACTELLAKRFYPKWNTSPC